MGAANTDAVKPAARKVFEKRIALKE